MKSQHGASGCVGYWKWPEFVGRLNRPAVGWTSSFVRHFGFLAFGVALSAEHAFGAVAASSGAILPAVKDNLEVKLVPCFRWKQLFQISLGLLDVFPIGQPPSLGQAVNVSVDGKCGYVEGLCHHDTCCFMTHTRQRLQGIEVLGDFAVVLVDQNFRQLRDRFWFARGKATRPNDLENFFDRDFSHLLRRRCQSKQRRCYFVDLFVGALSAQQDCNQQREWVGMVERNRRIRV